MESVASLVPRTLNAVANGNGLTPSTPLPKTLPDLLHHFEHIEAKENPDVVVPTDTLSMTPEGFVHVPALRGRFALTAWSRSSLASRLGIRWQRYAEDADEEDLADEVTRRMARATGEVRIRSTSVIADDLATTDGTIRAFVSPGYSPVADTRVTKLLLELLQGEDVSVSRVDVTPMTTSYVLAVGLPFDPRIGSQVGDVRGSVLVRNSGTSHSALFVSIALQRLVCTNGMTVSDDASLRRAHRGLDDARLRSLLATAVGNFGPRIREAADQLVRSTERLLPEPVKDTIERLVASAKLPKKILPDIYDAYVVEPHPSAFGVSQALTLAAQHMTPELRVELETLAGNFLAERN